MHQLNRSPDEMISTMADPTKDFYQVGVTTSVFSTVFVLVFRCTWVLKLDMSPLAPAVSEVPTSHAREPRVPNDFPTLYSSFGPMMALKKTTCPNVKWAPSCLGMFIISWKKNSKALVGQRERSTMMIRGHRDHHENSPSNHFSVLHGVCCRITQLRRKQPSDSQRGTRSLLQSLMIQSVYFLMQKASARLRRPPMPRQSSYLDLNTRYLNCLGRIGDVYLQFRLDLQGL